jgi:hypothetical protein
VTRFPLKVSFRVYSLCVVVQAEGLKAEVLATHGPSDNSDGDHSRDHRRCLNCMSTANPRRKVHVVDLSLYLVTGRHLLPPGMVSFSLSPATLLLTDF